jgi:glycerol-3-phosphate dehydrogenase (NAD(P)+)
MKVCIYGAGSWGTALAITFSIRSDIAVTLIPRRKDQAEKIIRHGENLDYLPNIKLPCNLLVDNNLSNLNDCDVLFMATPAQFFRQNLEFVRVHLGRDTPIIICAKGIEIQSGLLLTDVGSQICPNPLLVLSGPNFAKEVAINLPSAAVIASDNINLACDIAKKVRHPNFRLYSSSDPIGVQISGSVKNVLAIASGILQSKQFGQNALAALISRGLQETKRLGIAMGANSETFLGLSGVGDLSLTCSSQDSRNTSLGFALGLGATLEGILSNRKTVAEGVHTAKALFNISQKLNVRMPICTAVYKILYEKISVEQAIEDIFSVQSDFEN